jgi:hypothetical protein
MRSAWDLEVDHGDWLDDARCAAPDVHPDMWHVATKDPELGVAEAMHICHTHCPVRLQCHRDAMSVDSRFRQSTIQGGVLFDTNGVPRRNQPVAGACRLCGEADVFMRRERRREQWRRSAQKKRDEKVSA